MPGKFGLNICSCSNYSHQIPVHLDKITSRGVLLTGLGLLSPQPPTHGLVKSMASATPTEPEPGQISVYVLHSTI